MKSKNAKLFILLIVVSLMMFASCSAGRGCQSMRFHNDDVRKGLSH